MLFLLLCRGDLPELPTDVERRRNTTSNDLSGAPLFLFLSHFALLDKAFSVVR